MTLIDEYEEKEKKLIAESSVKYHRDQYKRASSLLRYIIENKEDSINFHTYEDIVIGSSYGEFLLFKKNLEKLVKNSNYGIASIQFSYKRVGRIARFFGDRDKLECIYIKFADGHICKVYYEYVTYAYGP